MWQSDCHNLSSFYCTFQSVSMIMVQTRASQHAVPMETKDTFMRIVVIASVIGVFGLAILVRMHS